MTILNFMISSTFMLMLSGMATASRFPSGSCSVRNCMSSPYVFTWVNETQISPTSGRMCFEVTQAPSCVEEPPTWCCTTLKNNANKILMTSPVECRYAVTEVTWNGVKRGGGTYFDVFDEEIGNPRGEFKITNLQSNFWVMFGSSFCITTKTPCTTIDTFCKDPTNDRDVACKATFYDVDAHKCCPACNMNNNLVNNGSDCNHYSPPPPQVIVTSPSPPPSPPPPPNPPPNPSRDTPKCVCTCRPPDNCGGDELYMSNCVCTCDWDASQCDTCTV